MKKKFINISLILSTTFLVAGGNIMSVSESISDKTCVKNSVIVDNGTKLMWQDSKYLDQEHGAYKNNRSAGKAGNWNHSKKYCQKLNLKGYSDWRLPTSEELQNVFQNTTVPFQYNLGSDYWSSTPTVDYKYNVVFSTDGMVYQRKKGQSNYIRCVRCVK